MKQDGFIHEPVPVNEKAVYMIGKENDGVIQILDKTSNTDKTVVTTEAQKMARENSHDYVVLKLISKHKKVVTTKDINYD